MPIQQHPYSQDEDIFPEDGCWNKVMSAYETNYSCYVPVSDLTFRYIFNSFLKHYLLNSVLKLIRFAVAVRRPSFSL